MAFARQRAAGPPRSQTTFTTVFNYFLSHIPNKNEVFRKLAPKVPPPPLLTCLSRKAPQINNRKQVFNVMASPAQIAANRANAQQSTGPRTDASKRRIASNALKHGLYSDTRINLFNEDHDFVKTLLTDLQGEYCPVTPTEHILAQQLATLQTHYLALIDNQAEDMYLDLREKFVVDPDTDSRYELAFEKRSQFNRAIIEAVERHGLHIPPEVKEQI